MNKNRKWYLILLDLARYCKGKMMIAVFMSVIGVLCGILPYYAVQKIIADVVNNQLTFQAALGWFLFAFICYMIQGIFQSVSTVLSHISAYTILEKLRHKVIDKFNSAPLGAVYRMSIGEIKNMVVDRIDSIEVPLAHVIPELIGNVILPIIAFIWLFTIHFGIALASLITLPLTCIPFTLLLKDYKEKYSRYLEAGNRMSSATVEYIEGIQVIKAFSKSDSAYAKYENAIYDFKHFCLDWMRGTWLATKLSYAIFPTTLLGTLPVGLLLYINQIILPQELVLALLLSIGMVGSLAKIEVFANDVKKMSHTIEMTADFLDIESLEQTYDEVDLTDFDIAFKNVSFTYENNGNKAINNMSISFPQNKFTALVGPSGGGKSTIARLMVRFWDADKGEIFIGKTNIKDIPLRQLTKIFSFVTQDNFLFNCSLMENIRIGNPNASEEQIIEASKKAMCHDFIMELEHGYYTTAGEAGQKLSGGQKQRIAIARIILKDAPIVILDEASAFTDPENEDKIQKSIEALTKGKTLICIAHRLSTIVKADNIVVIHEGTVDSSGKHHALIQEKGLYETLWLSHMTSQKRSTV